MKMVYLAHNGAAKDALKIVVELLEKAGIIVTSGWLKPTHKMIDCLEDALMDIKDIDTCDVFVLFVENYGSIPGRGKYFEAGYAYAKGKKIILVGTEKGLSNCVFYYLPTMNKVDLDLFGVDPTPEGTIQAIAKLIGIIQSEG